MSAGNGNSSTGGFLARLRSVETPKAPHASEQTIRSMAAQIQEQPIVLVDNPEVIAELKRTQERLSAMEAKFDALVREVKRSTEQRVARRNTTTSMSSVTSSTKNEAIKPSSAVEETTSGSRQSDD